MQRLRECKKYIPLKKKDFRITLIYFLKYFLGELDEVQTKQKYLICHFSLVIMAIIIWKTYLTLSDAKIVIRTSRKIALFIQSFKIARKISRV